METILYRLLDDEFVVAAMKVLHEGVSGRVPLSTQSTTHHIYVMQAEAALRLNGLRTPVVGRLAYWAASR